MGSATREALAAARSTLAGIDRSSAAVTGAQLLAATRSLGALAPLRAALADPSADESAKRTLVAAVFRGFEADALAVLDTVAASRWSDQDELVEGVEELGIRAIAIGAEGVDIEGELFAIGRVVASDAELELALGSKLGAADQKLALVDRLFAAKASEPTLTIVRHLVEQPRGRSFREALRRASFIVADESGSAIAIVTSATPLPPRQRERLERSLEERYGRAVRVNEVVDPAVVGGVRVQVGTDVIDGTVAARLTDLRLRLAG